ncbi:MAG: LysR family transcriptional regulator [Rhodospirillales bacterium]|nr:LysR family transcriptional regulator [Rhodospirillales bacterium]
MNWDDLRIFLAVVRSGSVRAAANALGVNHSTVSRRIDAFEKKLEVRLFERLPTGYLTTAEGEDMLQGAQRIEAEYAALDRRVVGRDARLTGLVRVTMPGALATLLLIPDLARFTEAYPDIEIELDASYKVADLSRREADVAIRLTNDPPDRLVGRRLLKFAKAIYASHTYLARRARVGEPPSFSWISWDDPSSGPQWAQNSPYPKAPIRHRVGDPAALLAAVKADMGIAMLPCFMGDAEPSLRRLAAADPVHGRDLWLLTHEDLRRTARIRKFLDFMADAILRHRDLLEGRRPQPETMPARPAAGSAAPK